MSVSLETAASKLKRGIASYVRTWPGQIDPPGVIRASGVHFLCPKKFFFNYWVPTERPPMDFSGHIFTGQGTFLHGYLQEVLLGTMGILKGTWISSDAIIEDDFMPVDLAHDQLKHFSAQDKHPVKYKEYWYYDEHWGLSGHCDGVVSVSRLMEAARLLNSRLNHPGMDLRKQLEDIDPDKDGYALLEIKTTNSHKFKNLEGPESISQWYKAQATIYQRLSGLKSTIFLYLDRDSASLKPVVFTHSLKEDWVPIKKKLTVIWESIRDEKIRHEFEACQDTTDKAAKECPFVERCFAEKAAKVFIKGARKSQPNRKWLDLTGWEPKNSQKIGGWLDSLRYNPDPDR